MPCRLSSVDYIWQQLPVRCLQRWGLNELDLTHTYKQIIAKPPMLSMVRRAQCIDHRHGVLEIRSALCARESAAVFIVVCFVCVRAA
eukprot:2723405-Rhodomonas_salina.3